MSQDEIPHKPRPQGVPIEAVCVAYTADNGKKGEYYMWKGSVGRGETRRDVYYWWALGNGGEEDTGFEATQAARAWIRNGLASVARTKQEM